MVKSRPATLALFCGSILFASLLFSGCAGMELARMQSQVQSNYKALQGHPIQPYLLCGSGDSLLAVVLNGRGDPSEKFRTIQTGSRTDTISVIDGYRIMYAYPDQNYFSKNVKVEQSDPNLYASDKKKLIDGMEWLVRDTTQNLPQLTRIVGGAEIVGLRATQIDKGGVLAIDNLFYDKPKIIVTVYYLNQRTKNRRFNTIEEFQTNREAFLNRWITCSEKADSAL